MKNSFALVHKYLYTLLITLPYFAGYLAAFVWYSPISPERRFTYGRYIPLMFSIFAVPKALNASQSREGGMDVRELVSVANLVVTLTLIVNIPLVLAGRMFFDRFGIPKPGFALFHLIDHRSRMECFN